MSQEKQLYFITDSSGMSEDAFLARVEEVCKAGVDLLQIREKMRSDRELLALTQKVKVIADRYHIPLFIDDRIDIAMIAGCHVHLGQSDIPVRYARTLLPSTGMVGATAKTVEQALEAEREGASYLGVGAIYPTTTKVVTVRTEVSTLNEICKAVQIPVYAIGGLNKDNLSILKGSPIAGICVVSAIMKAEDASLAVSELREAMQNDLRQTHYNFEQ